MKKRWITLLAVLFLASGCVAGQNPSPDASSSGGGAEKGASSSVLPAQEEFPEGSMENTDSLESQPFQLPAPEELFSVMPKDFIFMNGVGAWATELTLEPDGSFTGEYHNTDSGDPYPTEYFCVFSGTLSEPVQVDDYTFSTHVVELTQEGTLGETTYEDGFQFICWEPVGLAGADEILIYCPNALAADLPEDFVWWVELGGHSEVHESNELGCYGLYNVNEQFGFADYQYREG